MVVAISLDEMAEQFDGNFGATNSLFWRRKLGKEREREFKKEGESGELSSAGRGRGDARQHAKLRSGGLGSGMTQTGRVIA